MAYLEFRQQQIKIDEHGYLLEQQDWTPELAEFIASIDNINLTDEHWLIINFVRDFYQEYQTTPPIRMLVKALQVKFDAEIANSRYLQRLFPEGPAKQVAKIAGLPKPVKCL